MCCVHAKRRRCQFDHRLRFVKIVDQVLVWPFCEIRILQASHETAPHSIGATCKVDGTRSLRGQCTRVFGSCLICKHDVVCRLSFDTVAGAANAFTGVGLLVDDGATAHVAGEAP
jgi:hypothetical protein